MLNNRRGLVVLAIVALLFTGCQPKESRETFLWGETETYSNFLWKKHIPDTLKQTICFEFNRDAQLFMNSPIKFGIYEKDNDGKYIRVSESKMEVFVNGVKANNNMIVVPSNCSELEVGVVFNDCAENKTHYWYVIPIDYGGLDRINDKETTANTNIEPIMELKVKKNHIMNPLAKACLILFIFIVLCLILWFMILKTLFFPVFRVNRLELIGPDTYLNVIKIKHCRKLILTSKQVKQGRLNKVFSGQIKYSINPIWTADVEFMPRDKTSIRIFPDHSEYYVDTRILQINNDCILENNSTNSKTIIKLS